MTTLASAARDLDATPRLLASLAPARAENERRLI
jgi:hypothetical protein